jgi:hypothetical protein
MQQLVVLSKEEKGVLPVLQGNAQKKQSPAIVVVLIMHKI